MPEPTPTAEPVVTALIVNVVVAALTLVVSFGVDISADQRAGIVGLVTAICAVISTLWARSKVSPIK